ARRRAARLLARVEGPRARRPALARAGRERQPRRRRPGVQRPDRGAHSVLAAKHARSPERRGSNAAVSAAIAPLDNVDRALFCHLDRTAERTLGLVARPQRVELVGDVREDEAPRARLAAVLARLGGGLVAA